MWSLKRICHLALIAVLAGSCVADSSGGCNTDGCNPPITGGCPDDPVLMLSEVMAHPATNDQPTEYIEIYNAGQRAIPASCVVIYEGDFSEGEGRSSECDVGIAPGGYLVFSKNPAELALQTGLLEAEICELSMALTDDDLFGVGYVDSEGEEHPLESIDCAVEDCPVSEGVSMNRDLGELLGGTVGRPGWWCESVNIFHEDGDVIEHGTPGEENEYCEVIPDPPDCPEVAALMLSEVMPHPDTLGQPNEYIEVYNAGAEAIPASCVVIYEGAFGEDQGLGETSDCTLEIPPGGYQVFTAPSTENTENPLPSQMGVDPDDLCYLTMGLTDTEVFGVGYEDTDGTKHPLESADGGDEGFPVTEGASTNRDLADLLAGEVGAPATWCLSQTLFFEGEDATELGTPGEENEVCEVIPDPPECPEDAALMLSEVMPHPDTPDQPNEYIEVYNAGAEAIPASCVVIYEGAFGEDQGLGETSDCTLEIPPGGYQVFTAPSTENTENPLPSQMGVDPDDLCYLTMGLTDTEVFGVGYEDTDGTKHPLESADGGDEGFPVTEGASTNRDLADLLAGQVGWPATWCLSQMLFFEDDDATEFGTPGEENEGC